MPTGYTADVEDGKVTDFRTFALRCARNFGATIAQRENSLEELPKHREPSRYDAEALDKARGEVRRLATLTIEEADAEAEAEYARAAASYRESVRTVETENARYKAMLLKVRAWRPPTADHRGLKEFMIEQLEMSMHTWTPTAPTKRSGEEWLAERQKRAREDVGSAAKRHEEELACCTESNAWIDALYASLLPDSVPTFRGALP